MKTPRALQLPMWAGFRAGEGDEPSAGEVEVTCHGDGSTARQIAAVRATEERAPRMQPVLLEAIVDAYPTFRAWNERPKSITTGELRACIQLWEIIVSRDQHEDVAYVGYIFACAWDPSGLVVLTHGDRVVSAGGLEVLGFPVRDPARSAPPPEAPTAAQLRAAKSAATKGAKTNPATLRLDDDGEMRIYLPAWAGFAAGPSSTLSKGEVLLAVGSDGDGDGALGPEQEAAYRRVIDGAADTQRLVLGAIIADYAKLTRGAETAFELPKKVDRAGLERLVELVSVHIHGDPRDQVAYIGFGLACAWDGEHGLGVLTHGERVVKVGHADTSFLAWVADEDRSRKRD